jgi:hypothetical protein
MKIIIVQKNRHVTHTGYWKCSKCSPFAPINIVKRRKTEREYGNIILGHSVFVSLSLRLCAVGGWVVVNNEFEEV